MFNERLIALVPDAPWLPAGSTAEVWAGTRCGVPEPCVIVRLLLARVSSPGTVEFFCVPTHRGLDLPTLFLGSGPDRMAVPDGLAQLATATLGRADVETGCVGYVRNVVPRPDTAYPHPTPWAHVPVFAVIDDADPVVEGSWITLDAARPSLNARHWWTVVEHHLEPEAQ
ncbi:hypothetical protein Lfu02_00290 [Longispora fulva]|uniref:Uncharacterized protein n=1 Tax=Longispora fulva TaxID=619741 RepID=A0A8J7G999_9ACTN|nr:hypothetical protein [Longispora fulva]MBG6136098.1 hypothetical protein [Longispora fulva]GIG55657.1 hypothetical protein Lfu02_00290 [Longispora fulva]